MDAKEVDSNANTLPRIFIGGTGRSGTWILYKSLGCHESIHIFPGEMRFFIDPGGLLDLVNNLTNNYSPARARESLYYFERLMRFYLATPGKPPYAALDIPSWLGRDDYWLRLDRFCSELIASEYEGIAWNIDKRQRHEGRLIAWARGVRDFRFRLLGKEPIDIETLPREVLRDGKYFSDRRQLLDLTAAFVDDLFLHAAIAHRKKTWCEKTPQHLLHLDFIWELLPESVFIHIKRDPRGVAFSLMNQRWGPNRLEGACLWLKNVYQHWFDLKKGLDLNTDRYLEIKLEEFALSPKDVLTEITSRFGLENHFYGLPDISVEKVNYWKKSMSIQQIKMANEIFGPLLEKLGYDK
jgi:hypothetical protein